MENLKDNIRQEAARLGFSHTGFAAIGNFEELRPYFNELFTRQNYSDLTYLQTYLEKRLNPQLVVAEAKSVIALLMNYFPGEVIPEDDNYIISKYAYGSDYHVVVRQQMNELMAFIQNCSDCQKIRAFVDSGAILEKLWAQRCGVGWQGKNTLIINKTSGSFHFIGILLTDLELPPDQPETDHCGGCRKCLDACPTGALHHPYQLEIPLCIAYQTIENKGDIPDTLKEKLNNRIYGCDICQDVCPYNRQARPHAIPEFRLQEPLKKLRRDDWRSLNEAQFNQLFEHSPMKRTGFDKLVRNMG